MCYGPILPFVLRVLHTWWYQSLHVASEHARKHSEGILKTFLTLKGIARVSVLSSHCARWVPAHTGGRGSIPLLLDPARA